MSFREQSKSFNKARTNYSLQNENFPFLLFCLLLEYTFYKHAVKICSFTRTLMWKKQILLLVFMRSLDKVQLYPK